MLKCWVKLIKTWYRHLAYTRNSIAVIWQLFIYCFMVFDKWMFPREIWMQIKQVYPLLSLGNADTCVSCIKISWANDLFSNTIINILIKEQMVEIEMKAWYAVICNDVMMLIFKIFEINWLDPHKIYRCLGGKLRYLQHNCVGDSIFYHWDSNMQCICELSSLVWKMTLHLIGDKSLPKPMLTNLPGWSGWYNLFSIYRCAGILYIPV